MGNCNCLGGTVSKPLPEEALWSPHERLPPEGAAAACGRPLRKIRGCTASAAAPSPRSQPAQPAVSVDCEQSRDSPPAQPEEPLPPHRRGAPQLALRGAVTAVQHWADEAVGKEQEGRAAVCAAYCGELDLLCGALAERIRGERFRLALQEQEVEQRRSTADGLLAELRQAHAAAAELPAPRRAAAPASDGGRKAAPAAPTKPPAERRAHAALSTQAPAEGKSAPPPSAPARRQPPAETAAPSRGAQGKPPAAPSGVPRYMQPLRREPRSRAAAPAAASPGEAAAQRNSSPPPRPIAPPGSAESGAPSAGLSSSIGAGAEADGGGSAPRRSPSPAEPRSALAGNASQSNARPGGSSGPSGRLAESCRSSTLAAAAGPSGSQREGSGGRGPPPPTLMRAAATSRTQPADSGAHRASANQPSPAAPEPRAATRASAVPGCAALSAPKDAPEHPGASGPQPPVPTAPAKRTAQQPAERAAAPAAPVKTTAESAELPPLPSERPQPPPERGAATASSSSKSKAHAGVPSYMRPLQRAARTRIALSAACPSVQECSQERSPRPRPPAPPSAGPGLELPSRVAASASCGSSSRGGEAEADGGGNAPRRSPSPVAPASCLTASASRGSMQTADSGQCGGPHTESRRPSTAPTGSTHSLRTVGSEGSVRHNPTPPPQGGEERTQPGGGDGVRRVDSQGPAARLQQPPARAGPVSRRAPPASTLVRFWRGEAAATCVCRCVQGRRVDWILSKRGKYDWLEHAHHYVQWLFPKTNNGVAGACAPPLTKEDAALLAADQEAAARFERGFLMMAAFWGFEPDAGSALRRTADSQERFENIRKCDHNLLRITRVLISATLLRRGDLAVQLAEAFLDAVAEGSLPGARQSLVEYWLPAIGGAEGKRLRRKASDAGLSAADLPRSQYFGSGCRAALH